MMQIGRPRRSVAASRALLNACTSWPSASRTSQPKARHLSSSGSMGMMSSTKPSSCTWSRSTMATRSIQAELGRGHGAFPDDAGLQLAVAQQHVYAIVQAVQPAGERHAHADRDAVAQRAGADVDARAFLAVGVALQPAADLAQREQLVARHIASQRENGVERRRGMPFG